jgi:hypothetical protein
MIQQSNLGQRAHAHSALKYRQRHQRTRYQKAQQERKEERLEGRGKRFFYHLRVWLLKRRMGTV